MVCIVCGRRLKAVQSKELGYGPVCYKKLFGISLRSNSKAGQSLIDVMDSYVIPGQMSMEEYLRMDSA